MSKTVFYCPKCGSGELWAPPPRECPSHSDVKKSNFIMTYVPDGQCGILDATNWCGKDIT